MSRLAATLPLLVLAVTATIASPTFAAEKPNILVVLADDLGYSDLGCYGGEIRTPHIDGLAKGGVKFSQAYTSARCCPTRASLLTGLYPTQAGIGDFTTNQPSPNRGPGYLGRLRDECVTMAEALKPAGYGCYYVGKWHCHPETGPIARGFDEFYGYTRDHSHDQYDADYYIRLPEGRRKEVDPPADEFYATDVFNEYALEFLRQGRASEQPWFLFLGHSSPHFPVQAPAVRADEYDREYRRGWDALREARWVRQRELGLVDGDRWTFTDRSLVPVDRDDIANGYSGQPNPAWADLPEERQLDLARRMAVFAAMVTAVDDGIGRVVEHLASTGELDNTLILFLSDNGACYEWGPFGFDGTSRRGETILRTGEELRDIGGRGTHQSYGSGWANLGNTPLRLYKHFTHEGGLATPLIAHWPRGLAQRDDWIRDPVHVMDILPTLLDAAGAEYPANLDGRARTPLEGTSLLPVMRGMPLAERTIGFDHQAAHALRKGNWKLVWGKRFPEELKWELYDIANDRCEVHDLADEFPDRVRTMAAEWEQWATRVGVTWDEPKKTTAAAEEDGDELATPEIARRPLTIAASVKTSDRTGVVVAQGGRVHGYSVHLIEGRPAFDVRVNGEVTRIVGRTPVPERFRIEGQLTATTMTLSVNGREVANGGSPGLIPAQPKDGLDAGRDERSAAGDYESPNPLDGTVANVSVETGEVEQPRTFDGPWRYTLRKPAEGWTAVDFDDSKWRTGNGGFGDADTPGARIGTEWLTSDIWLRRTFELDEVPAKPGLLLHHDEDLRVSINGREVLVKNGYITEYTVVPLDDAGRAALREGENTLAITCHQTGGGQYVDVHVVDTENVPKLPPAATPDKPFQSELITEWGEKVTPENAWREYPRPALARDDWTNLNGTWDYAITPGDRGAFPENWDGEILVPFAVESKLSGVQRLLAPGQALWYRRTFEGEKSETLRTLLNFEAVDYRSTVWVNGQRVGEHVGGNLPFSFDVTDALRDGRNEVVLRVTDATDTPGTYQLHGKQRIRPRGIWYTPVSGIWQTVWMERVPAVHVVGKKTVTQLDGTVRIELETAGDVQGTEVKVIASLGDQEVSSYTGPIDEIVLKVDEPKLWSPDSPTLYDLRIELGDDVVESYVGIREVGRVRDADGHWRFTLNGEELFQLGPLDQGWWPDGLLTPPSDQAMASDVEFLKAAGFNTIRKHIKVEPRRYYTLCDRLGMLVWQDQVSSLSDNPKWTRLAPNPEEKTWPREAHGRFMSELELMIDTLHDHPSIVQWVPFNEAWGQHQTVEVGEWTANYDPTRIVNVASGGNFHPAGHVVDHHSYPHPAFPFDQGAGGRFDDYVKVVGEFGGHGYPVEGHLWNPGTRNWGYGGLPKDKEEWLQRYKESMRLLGELKAKGIAAGIYTQTTDVEGEINGLITYDRRVRKITPAQLAAIHAPLYGEKVAVRKPRPPMDAATIKAGLASHDRALHIKAGWIRDPYITLAPDGWYYLTGTTPNPGDPREETDPYNTGLGDGSIVGQEVQLWRSRDLVAWESLGSPFTLTDGYWAKQMPQRFAGEDRTGWHLWAPEVHFLDGRWHLVHTSPGPVRRGSNLAVTKGDTIEGPYEFPLGDLAKGRHDPSLFRDEDGTVWLLWGNTMLAPLAKDLTSFTADPVRIDPAGSRPGPNGGEPINRIGHEGATIRRIGEKYVHFGTAWSTDLGRRGSYNLYYCTADRITGPYGPRRFAGRFLGHGTPFRDADGRWWCTAFYNGNVPPLDREGIEPRNLAATAQTINEQGVTIVPLEVRTTDDGDVRIRAKDPAYATPGPDEVQNFDE